MSRDVDHALEYSNRLIKHALCVCVEVSDRKGTPVEMSLKKKVGFYKRTLEIVLVHRNWD